MGRLRENPRDDRIDFFEEIADASGADSPDAIQKRGTIRAPSALVDVFPGVLGSFPLEIAAHMAREDLGWQARPERHDRRPLWRLRFSSRSVVMASRT